MLEIFQYDFMLRAFAAGLTVAIIAPLIGTFLVVRRLSLLAETLAHVSLLGIAVGLITGFQPVLTATITAVGASFGIEKLRTNSNLFAESTLALFLSGSLALASVLISLANGFNRDLLSFLFGSITTVTATDLIFIAGLAILTLLAVILLTKELFLVSFDEELAVVNGVNAKLINNILIILAAITVAVAMRIVGVLLIGALMVIPVLAAMQFAKSFKHIMAFSLIISLISVIGGLFSSFYLDLASGGTIVLIALILFMVSAAWRSLRA